MHAQNPFVDDSCHGKKIKHIRELLPKTDVIPTLALVVKAIHTRDLLAFVVSSEQENFLRVLNFVC